MKLEPELVREIMLFLENKIDVSDSGEVFGATVDSISESVNGRYNRGEIIYTLQRLEEGGYISAQFEYAGGRLSFGYVNAITYYGHEFLNLIRDNTTWSKTKKAVGTVGAQALSVIANVATTIITAAIQSSLLP